MEAMLVLGKGKCFDPEKFTKHATPFASEDAIKIAPTSEELNFAFCVEADRRIDAVRAVIGESMRSGVNVITIISVFHSTKKCKTDGQYIFRVDGQIIHQAPITPYRYQIELKDLEDD